MPIKMLTTDHPSFYKEQDGGTGARTPSKALEYLNGISKKDTDKLIILNFKGYIDRNDLPPQYGEYGVMLEGTNTVRAGQPLSLFITNYNSFIEYDISFDGGTVSRDGDTITLIPRIMFSAATKKLTINGRELDIHVTPISLTLTALIVGAGGGGGGPYLNSGGAGGGGGYVTEMNIPNPNLDTFEVDIQVGTGGNGGTYYLKGEDGTASSLSGSMTAYAAGGKGGDPGIDINEADYATKGQGGDAGTGSPTGIGRGGNTSNYGGDDGQPGTAFTISSTYKFGAGGGGGSGSEEGFINKVGNTVDGSGKGGILNTSGTDAAPYTGAGGGGAGYSEGAIKDPEVQGGRGSDGVVVFCYNYSEPLFIGGEIEFHNGRQFHIFKTNGTLKSIYKQ